MSRVDECEEKGGPSADGHRGCVLRARFVTARRGGEQHQLMPAFKPRSYAEKE